MTQQIQNDQWVTLRTFTWLQEALVMQGMLTSHGIECSIPEKHIGTIHPGVTGMTIHVHVKKSQLEEAQALINSFAEAVSGSPDECPHCGGEMMNRIIPLTRNWFNAIIGFLTVVPFRRQRAKKFCPNCNR